MSESLQRHNIIVLKIQELKIREFSSERGFGYGHLVDHLIYCIKGGGYSGDGMRVKTGSLRAHPCLELANIGD